MLIAAVPDLHLHQMDATTAILNRDWNEHVFIEETLKYEQGDQQSESVV